MDVLIVVASPLDLRAGARRAAVGDRGGADPHPPATDASKSKQRRGGRSRRPRSRRPRPTRQMRAPGRRVALAAVKAFHTAAFLLISGSIGVILVDGLRGRPTGRTGAAAAVALTECAVFAANGLVCPLTPLAERLGAERGSVTDIFLPDWLARNLTVIATPILVVGLVANVIALRRR